MSLDSSSPFSLHDDDTFLFTSPSTANIQLPESDSRQPTSELGRSDFEAPTAPSVQTSTTLVFPSPSSPPTVLLPPTLRLGTNTLTNGDRGDPISLPAKELLNSTHHKMQSGSEATVNGARMGERAIHSSSARGHKNDYYSYSTHNELLTTSPQLDGHATINTKRSAKKQSPPKQLTGNIGQASITSVRDLSHPRQNKEGSGSTTFHGSPSSVGRRPKALQLPSHFALRPSSMAQIPDSMSSKVASPATNIDVSRRNDWSHWLELGVDFRGFPPKVTTKDVWKVLKAEGEILTIELFDDDKGNLNGRGRVRFSPSPSNPFWLRSNYPARIDGDPNQYSLSFRLLQPKRDFLQPSLVDPKRRYPESMALGAEYLDFGFMYEQTTMMGMYRAATTASNVVTFRLNLLHREIEVTFQITFRDQKAQGTRPEGSDPKSARPIRIQDYVFVIPLAQATVIHQILSGQQSALLLSLETPPNFYRKYDGMHTHQCGATFWNRRNTLFRQTDIMYDPRKLKDAPLTLKKTRPTIDIGRWNTYHFVFDMAKTDRALYTTMCNALRDFNIEILSLPQFKLATNREPAVWEYIDRPVPSAKGRISTALDDLMSDNVPPLSFPVRYQLEVCISEGWLNEYNMTKEFVDRLMSVEPTKAQDLLEYISNQKRRVFNPMDIFGIKILKGSASRLKIPHYCTYVRSATVTPTMIYFSTPYVETSNRVLRQYSEHADRFLRVRFTDEKFQGKLNSNEGESMNEIYTRVKRALNNGITIGDRHFEYLASGNSQFREHGAYFFCPLAHLGVADIRKWMGDFQDIKVVAKYAARLGQCFSTTRAINGSRVDMIEIPDIRNGKFLFTDGVGKMSKFLAQLAASEVGVHMPTAEPPSVFQFRLGGAKGVLAVSSDAKMREIHIRNSQYKFHAIHSGLEIIRWSQFSAAHLNRQLIVVLSALQVPSEVFVDMLKNQLSNLAQAMTDEKMALALLQREIDPNQMTLVVAALILDGFQRVKEPFVLSLLQLWRAWSTKYLKEKAKIVVHKGAVLLGCVDETRTLKGHFDKIQHLRVHGSEEERIKSLPEVFVQLSKGANDKPQIMLGPMILARNPSLHPGDIRIVCGVDVPALHHLKDAVALPQTGDRDVAHMCSGGDLDGDDYLVIWDKDLLPREWNHPPMDYTPPDPVVTQGNVTTDDITTFFVNYMKNDTLPRIAHAHLAYADYLENGVKDEKCIALAALHSRAVDYMKTGVHAEFPPALRPKKWPHFMEKRHKPKDQIYVSRKVLGQLYDQVERVDFAPEFETPFDKRILTAYELGQEILAEAADVKAAYDAAMYRVMAQHEIGTEFEVWSTFVLQHANQSKDFKFHEEIGAISAALKDRFRTACYEKAGGRDFDQIGPFVAAMYQVTDDQVVGALERRQKAILAGKLQKGRQPLTQSMPLMSFPWLFAGILGKIANGELIGLQTNRQDFTLPLQGQLRKITPRKRGFGHGADGEEDVLKTAEGLVHRGELLKLFDHDEGGPDSSISGTSGPVTPDGNRTMRLSIAQNGNDSLLDELIAEGQGTEGVAVPLSAEVADEVQKTDLVSLDERTGLEASEELGQTAKEAGAPESGAARSNSDQRKSPSTVAQANCAAIPTADALIDLGFGDGNDHRFGGFSAFQSDESIATSLLDIPDSEGTAANYPRSLSSTALFKTPPDNDIAVSDAMPLSCLDKGLVYEEHQSASDEAKQGDRANPFATNGEAWKKREASQEDRGDSLGADEKDEAFIGADGQPSLLERLTLIAEGNH